MDRQRHWETIYAGKPADEVTWYQAHPEISLGLIDRVTADRSRPVIDIGGGASTLVDHLLDAGYGDVEVLDVAQSAIDAARKRLGPRADAVAWTAADITRWRPDRRYAVWHDRAVFHFLTEAADRRAYVATLDAALEDDGHLIIATFALDGPEKCSGLPVVRYDAAKLSGELGPGFSLVDETREVHHTPLGRTQSFAYFLFRRTG